MLFKLCSQQELFFQWYGKTLFEAENPKNLLLETLATAEFDNEVIRGVELKMSTKRLDIGGGFSGGMDLKLKGL